MVKVVSNCDVKAGCQVSPRTVSIAAYLIASSFKAIIYNANKKLR